MIDGKTGFVTRDDSEFGAAAIRLLVDDGLWLAQHRACLELQRSRGWDDMAAEFEALIP